MTDRRHDIQQPWTLACEDLSVARGGRTVLSGLNLELHDGECLLLIGPNGSGKTSLLLAMLGLLPPAAGSVRVNGRDLSDLGTRQRGRFASYVPQTVERIPGFSVREVVAAGRFPHVSPLQPLSEADTVHVDQALLACGLTDLAERRIDAVSGGERQKALIAAAIAQDAQAMFLDEPNTALDPAYQVELAGLLRSWRERGRTLVVVSHDLQLPAALGGRVIALREGQVVADGAVDEVLAPPRLSEVYDAAFEFAETADGRRIVTPRWWSGATAGVD
jgi:iron complex transport system ATP-binding protein